MIFHYQLILRHPLIHQIPERFLVIFFSQVSEFMDDDRINEVSSIPHCQGGINGGLDLFGNKTPLSYRTSLLDRGVFEIFR